MHDTHEEQHTALGFVSPAGYAQQTIARLESPRGALLVASCRSGQWMAARVVERYQQALAAAGEPFAVPYLPGVDYQFSDSETCARLPQDVNGCDVFLFQALYDPTAQRSIDENLLALLVAARAFREWGANHVTAVLPHLAYARQDKATHFVREPTTAKLVADLCLTAGVDRLVVWHPHVGQLHGFFGSVPVDMLEPLRFFVNHFRQFTGRSDVVAVAPDAGASKFVTDFGRALGVASAVASKYRPRPEEASVSEVIGDLSGKRIAIVLDDMISTGGTVDVLVRKLVEEHDIEEVQLAASHCLGMPQACDRLLELHQHYRLKHVIVTDSIPQTPAFLALPFLQIAPLEEILTVAVNHIHYIREVTQLDHLPAARGPG